MSDWQPTTIEDWRKMAMGHWHCYEDEQRNHKNTKLRLQMQSERATCLERILLRLLFDVDKALVSDQYITDESRWKRAHHRLEILLDDELDEGLDDGLEYGEWLSEDSE